MGQSNRQKIAGVWHSFRFFLVGFFENQHVASSDVQQSKTLEF
jgi:hypothetical protein